MADPWYLKHMTPEIGGAIYTVRVSSDAILVLRALRVIEKEIQRITPLAVEELREQGHSWADIAEAMGVTRQAAQKLARRSRQDPPDAT